MTTTARAAGTSAGVDTARVHRIIGLGGGEMDPGGPPPPPREPFAVVSLVEADRELFQHAPAEMRAGLARRLLAPVRTVERGTWRWRGQSDDSQLLGLVVLDGFLIREVEALGRIGVELLGRGDVIRPAQREEPASIPYRPRWRVLTPTTMAVLTSRLGYHLGQVPGAMSELFGRLVSRARNAERQLAMARIHPLESRLVVLLWNLADRWGRRRDGAVVLEPPLSHDLIAELAGASQPPVTRALGRLQRHGSISRRDDKRWILHGSPPVEIPRMRAHDSAGPN